jgi:hypothetical protein
MNMKRTSVTALALTLPLAGANAQQWSTHALPAGLIAWWAAEGNLLDAVGAHHGDGSAAPTFAPERKILPTVGQARDRLSYNQGSRFGLNDNASTIA